MRRYKAGRPVSRIKTTYRPLEYKEVGFVRFALIERTRKDALYDIGIALVVSTTPIRLDHSLRGLPAWSWGQSGFLLKASDSRAWAPLKRRAEATDTFFKTIHRAMRVDLLAIGSRPGRRS